MRKLSVAAITLLLLALMAMPALAQSEATPVEEVLPIEVEEEEALPAVDEPAPEADVAAEAEAEAEAEVTAEVADDVTAVMGTPLAETGFGLFEASMLAGGLLLAGLGSVWFARRRLSAGE